MIRSIKLFVVIFTASSPAFAGQYVAEERHAATAFVRTEFSFITHKSALVTSNDTGMGYAYTLGGHLGVNRNVGVLYANDMATVNFGINKGKIQTTWTDTIIRYRYGCFYLGAVIANMALVLTPPESQNATVDGDTPVTVELDVLGSGYGANAGMVFGFGRANAWYLDIISVSTYTARDVNQTDVSVGSRMDIDTGVSFFLNRQSLDLLLGYRMRNFAVSTEESYAEKVTATYLGLRYNGFF